MFLKNLNICQFSNFKIFQILEAFWLEVALLQVDIRNSALEDSWIQPNPPDIVKENLRQSRVRNNYIQKGKS